MHGPFSKPGGSRNYEPRKAWHHGLNRLTLEEPAVLLRTCCQNRIVPIFQQMIQRTSRVNADAVDSSWIRSRGRGREAPELGREFMSQETIRETPGDFPHMCVSSGGTTCPRAPNAPYPQVRWYSTPLASTRTIFSGDGRSPKIMWVDLGDPELTRKEPSGSFSHTHDGKCHQRKSLNPDTTCLGLPYMPIYIGPPGTTPTDRQSYGSPRWVVFGEVLDLDPELLLHVRPIPGWSA